MTCYAYLKKGGLYYANTAENIAVPHNSCTVGHCTYMPVPLCIQFHVVIRFGIYLWKLSWTDRSAAVKNGRKKNWLTGNAASDYSCHLHGQEPLTGEGRILTAHPENLWIKDSDWNWNPLLDIWHRKSSAPIRYLDINELLLIFCFFAKKTDMGSYLISKQMMWVPFSWPFTKTDDTGASATGSKDHGNL